LASIDPDPAARPQAAEFANGILEALAAGSS